ncbi:MAG: hypothetical protein A4S16_09745, partial [Proteobacteria bacterium SG_bin6]
MTPADPTRRLALAYAPRASRAGLAALLALDDTLAAALRLGRDPAVRQLRLTWWYEALGRLDTAPPPPEPLLQALAAELLPRGVRGAELAALTDGWEVLLNPDPLSEAGLLAYAEGRGRVFTLAARVLRRAGAGVTSAGQGWALAELAGHVSRAEEARAAAALAAPLLAAGLR